VLRSSLHAWVFSPVYFLGLKDPRSWSLALGRGCQSLLSSSPGLRQEIESSFLPRILFISSRRSIDEAGTSPFHPARGPDYQRPPRRKRPRVQSITKRSLCSFSFLPSGLPLPLPLLFSYPFLSGDRGSGLSSSGPHSWRRSVFLLARDEFSPKKGGWQESLVSRPRSPQVERYAISFFPSVSRKGKSAISPPFFRCALPRANPSFFSKNRAFLRDFANSLNIPGSGQFSSPPPRYNCLDPFSQGPP